MTNKTRISSDSAALMSGLTIVLLLGMAIPAAAQYQVYDLGPYVTTQDIQADNTNTVHIIWTHLGVLYYGKIVNNAITGAVEVARGVNTIFWRPYVSVQPDGSSVHIAWTTASMGNMLMHSWKTTGAWTTETVLTVPTTQWLCQPTCAIDSSGIVHVMFVIWNNVRKNQWSTIFYMRKLVSGQWETIQRFTPLSPEYKHPMLFVDSTGRVHATWTMVGRSGYDSYDAYYCTTPSGGTLAYANSVKLPKSADCSVNGYGDLYVDRNGVVHRSIGSWSSAVQKMCIDHTKSPVGGSFETPTRASIVFLDIKEGDPVPAVVAGEDGKVVVAWGQIGSDGSNTVMASFYDPGTLAWSIYTIDPAAGIPTSPNSYRVALTRTDTHLYGVWRASTGRLKLFVMTIGATSKKDFNGDGQEDILWRYYGPGGYNLVWYLGPTRGGLGNIEGTIMNMPLGEVKPIDMLHGAPPQVFVDPREASGLLTEKASQQVLRDAREAGGLLKREGEESPNTQESKHYPVIGGPGEIEGFGKSESPVMRVTGLTWTGNGWLPAVTDLNWKIAGTGDFNRDGKVDILWRHYGPGVGNNVVWYMDGMTWMGNAWLPAVTDLNWKIAGTGDFNRDGKVDILWRHYGPGVGNNAVWYMDGAIVTASESLPTVTDTDWEIAGTGDFNRDGKVDVLWRHYGPGVGNNAVWYMDGAIITASESLPTVTDTDWEIAGTGDFNRDGKVDILWRHYGPGVGNNAVWYMDGAIITASESLPTETDVNWRIENH